MVEVAPDIDSGGLTVQAADGILVDMIATISKKKRTWHPKTWFWYSSMSGYRTKNG